MPEILTEIHGREIGLDDDRALVVRSGIIRSQDEGPVAFPDGILNSNTSYFNLKDFGAVGDGSTDDTAAVTLAEASSFDTIYLPPGRYLTTLTVYQAINKKYVGPGQLVMGGYGQAPSSRSFITSAPTVPSTNRAEMFDSGFKKAHRASSMFIGSGVNPGVLPSTYTNYTEWSQDIIVHECIAGYNTDAARNSLGRSGAFRQRSFLYHGGGGDLTDQNFYGSVYATRSGATHFLACPAIIFQNGNLGASGSSTGAYLNHSEFVFSDNGIAVAAINHVRNYFRTNSSETLYQKWIHDRPQSSGSQPINCFYSPSGIAMTGMDFSCADFQTNKAAIALKPNDRIYWNTSATTDPVGARWYADTLNTEYTTYNSTKTALIDTLRGVTAFTVSNDASSVNWVGVRGRATSGRPRVYADGSDTDVSLSLVAKAAGLIAFETGGVADTGGSGIVQFSVFHTASTVNYLSATGAVAGGSPILQPGGSDSNAHVLVQGKGTSGVILKDGATATKFRIDTTGIAFFNGTSAAKQTVTGSRGGNAALASLLTALATYGLLTDSSTA